MKPDSRHIRSPFKFLDPYGREDGAIFFGRREEVEALYQSVNKNRLVLVYGQSGTGKTSVVQCGLANRFEVTDWMPFFVRRGKDINASLRQALSQSKALGGTAVTADNLLTALERISARYVRPVYLIFDQFEELLILGDEEEQEPFITKIQQILASEQTQSVNLLFILREEYFAWLDRFERLIPGFSDRRLRVEPMRPARLEEVIVHSCEALNITLENPPENARSIIKSLRSKGGIPLPYLQVYLDMLWREDYVRTYPAGWEGKGFAPLEFTSKEIGDFGAIENVLDRFLTERTEAIQQDLAAAFPDLAPDAVRQVLNAFATEEGTKRPVPYRQEEEQIVVEDSAPTYLRQLPAPVRTQCFRALEQSRLLRSDEESYELAHDTLAALIDQRRTDEERRLNEVRRQIRSSYQIYRQTGDFLTEKQLTTYEDILPDLDLDAQLARFVDDSRQYRQTERQQQLEQERRKRRRTQLIAIVMTVLAGLSVAAGIFAFRTLLNLQRTTADVVRYILQKEVDPLILRLDYDAAARRISSAIQLKAAEREVALALLDPAFWYGEVGQYARAAGLLDTAAQLLNNRDVRDVLRQARRDSSRALSLLRTAMMRLDRERYDSLARRYYPDMVTVEGGTFWMGCDRTVDEDCDDDETRHQVTLNSYRIARTETTFWQFGLYCAATGRDINDHVNKSWGEIEGHNPVIYVDWYDALEYANWVSTQQGVDTVFQIDKTRRDTILNQNNDDDKRWTIKADWQAGGYRLPTEAEWEYAARGGRKSNNNYIYAGSNDLGEVAWHWENSGSRIHPVKTKKWNELGLYDLSGNLWEWCWDWYDANYYTESRNFQNPKGPESGSFRVLRGGSWINGIGYSFRVAVRVRYIPDVRFFDYGFRLAQD